MDTLRQRYVSFELAFALGKGKGCVKIRDALGLGMR